MSHSDTAQPKNPQSPVLRVVKTDKLAKHTASNTTKTTRRHTRRKLRLVYNSNSKPTSAKAKSKTNTQQTSSQPSTKGQAINQTAHAHMSRVAGPNTGRQTALSQTIQNTQSANESNRPVAAQSCIGEHSEEISADSIGNTSENQGDHKHDNQQAADEKKVRNDVKAKLTSHWDLDQLPRDEYERLMRQGKDQFKAVQRTQMKRFVWVVVGIVVAMLSIAVLTQ